MRSGKSIKFIIAAVLVVAIVICGVLVATKTDFFEEETTTEPETLATTRITFIEGITVNECFKLLEENSVAFQNLSAALKQSLDVISANRSEIDQQIKVFQQAEETTEVSEQEEEQDTEALEQE